MEGCLASKAPALSVGQAETDSRPVQQAHFFLIKGSMLPDWEAKPPPLAPMLPLRSLD